MGSHFMSLSFLSAWHNVYFLIINKYLFLILSVFLILFPCLFFQLSNIFFNFYPGSHVV
jgi:hypothetical protein